MARSIYRARQFLGALRAQVEPEEWRVVENRLTPEAVALFRKMPRNDQRHSLDVLYTLRSWGHDDPALFTAALLHDVAKAGGIRLWHRVLVVLIRVVGVSWLQRLASPDPRSWRYAFYLHIHHSQIGAMWAEESGCAPETAELIRRHQEPVTRPACATLDEWLIALQKADGQN